jgi:GH25 family lysozyme M1 (1,4-beta-N-acetylmuramidase)
VKKELLCFLIFILSHSIFSQTILGIDVSHHQGDIDWQLVSADGKVFAYVKATEGMTYTDPKFVTNITNGNSAGVIMGAYHYARPDNNTAIQDANNFIHVAGSYIGNGKLPPALDLEDTEDLPTLDSRFSSNELSNWVEQWLITVENQTGVRPIIYTTSHYANYLNSSLNSYELWIAKPGTSATSPPTNLGIWNDWIIKQYSWEGSVQGISGFTDLNSFHGSTNDFNNFISNNSSCSSPTNLSITNITETTATFNWSLSNALGYEIEQRSNGGTWVPIRSTTSTATSLNLSGLNSNTEYEIRIKGMCSGGEESGWVTVTFTTSGGSSNNNDNCNDAITLQSNQNCNYVSGTVDNATSGNSWNDATCDLFSGNSLAADVFYKFTASSNEHTITINPNGDLDAVVGLYQGSSCNNLNEVECEDTSGGNGTITIMNANNLNIGTTYWIRIYDYGSQPPSNGGFDICITHSNSGGSEDVSVTNATASPTSVNAGEDINVSADQNYSGSQTVDDLTNIDLDYYLSIDCNLSSDDILLGTDSSTIGSDDTSDTESETLTVPSNTANGTYYIIFSADNGNEVNESNENNNIACIQIIVGGSGGSEDVTVTNATASPTSVNAGEDINVSADQNYSGSQTVDDLPNIDLDYYLSIDCNLSSDDILLGTDNSTIGIDDTSDTESKTLTIPSNTANGTYYIIFSADNENEVNESNENNNIACIQIIVSDALSLINYEFQKTLTIYPNPASDIINIKSENNLILNKLILYDLNGRKIKEKQGTNLNKIKISELTSGIYLLKVVSNENKKAFFRIMKK